jgi:hypothetical protein
MLSGRETCQFLLTKQGGNSVDKFISGRAAFLRFFRQLADISRRYGF